MLRLGLLTKLSTARVETAIASQSAWRSYVAESSSGGEPDERDIKAARDWLKRFDTVPENWYTVSYSRSSGPGGQNVNKTDSKATLKAGLGTLFKSIPRLLHRPLQESRFVTNRSEAILISSDDSRSQKDNRHNCQVKLHNLICEIGRQAIPGETSQCQKNKVKQLAKTANDSRLREKKARSHKKSTRRGRSSSGDY